MRPLGIILLDVFLVGLTLVVFSLFHHVFVKSGEPIGMIVEIEPAPTPKQTPRAALPAATPEPTPEPVYAPGDFSAAFPAEDTGVNAMFSYQSDSMRLAVNEVQQNGITYFVADVWVRNIASFKTAFAGGQYGQGQRERPEKIAEENGAILAVTGDYYGARSSGVVIRNGVLYRDKPYEDVCVLYIDGTMETYTKQDFDLDTAIAKKAWQAWSFGPMLLKDGAPIVDYKGHIGDKNPRCGIGYYEPGHYCLVVVDGREAGYSSGMTIEEFSALFLSLGCKAAYNLDGGATAQMVFQNEVINRPSDGGRKSSDILYFGVSEG